MNPAELFEELASIVVGVTKRPFRPEPVTKAELTEIVYRVMRFAEKFEEDLLQKKSSEQRRTIMGLKKVATLYWTCDRKGCPECGQGEIFPEDWRRMTIFTPSAPGKPPHVPADASVLLCPKCADLLKREINIKPKKEIAEVAA